MQAVTIGNAKFRGQRDQIPAFQFYPFFDNKALLQRQLGLNLRHLQADSLSDIATVAQSVKADVFFVRPFWQDNPTDVEWLMTQLRHHHPSAYIVFIDPFDQTSSRFFNVLPYVDCFSKQQRLRDVHLYTQPLAGGSLLTDRLSRELGYELNGWNVGSDVPEEYESRIETGWFVTLTPRFKRELFRPQMPWEQAFYPRDIDVFCHVSCGARNNLEWYGQHRMAAHEVLQRLAPDYRLSISCEYSGERTVSTRRYFQEIRRSRIAFSPFGWGEITLRDYEAVCYGCLLVKPSVEHITVEPNIFIAGETYVPVQWDYCDLEEKCRFYLNHPDQANRIIANARQAYMDYFKHNRFVKQLADHLRLPPTSEASLPSSVMAQQPIVNG